MTRAGHHERSAGARGVPLGAESPARPSTRRGFLATIPSLLALPALFAGCGKGSSKPGADDGSSPGSEDDAVTATGPGPPIPTTEPLVRVRIRAGRPAADPVHVGAEGQWIEFTALGGNGDDDVPLPPVILHGPATVGAGAGGWSILDGRGFRPSVRGWESIELRAADAGDAIALDDERYPGALRFVPRTTSPPARYDVVNVVGIEAYLPGVLARELYSHWHPETFAAQAIAARSFATSEISYRGARHFDVTNTSASQMYVGSVESRRAVEGAEATRGIVLAYGDVLVPGYYSSCCGGLAADAADAIGEHPYNALPPLRGRDGPDVCVEAPLYAWTTERSRRDLRLRLASYGKRTGDPVLVSAADLASIDVSGVNAHGRPRAFAVAMRGDASTQLGAEAFRRAADYSGRGGLAAPKPKLYSSYVTVTLSRSTVKFEGAGHGHGVGLCQYGAEALARSGLECAEIMAWYYPQVELVSAYGAVG